MKELDIITAVTKAQTLKYTWGDRGCPGLNQSLLECFVSKICSGSSNILTVNWFVNKKNLAKFLTGTSMDIWNSR